MESGFLCNGEEGKAVAQDAKSLAGILPSTIKRLALSHLREEQARILFARFQMAGKGGS